ncbi:acyltransferase family protein [Paenibacillus chibensis]|uniref:acyltransferase family protein n=1 Tax=Paenibacillus chibensis TaxID=59846 RepID=UPI001FE733F0|nr:acyltransferase family protein [Paenibacillus chibensis]MEC0370271.1 acyltransferase family protein [Paenibacillus chibensis]
MIDNMSIYRERSHQLSALQRGKGKHYMPGLDGLRALSVLAVIAYHLNLKWAQGGLIGVGIFFVISGYLITDQLLQEWKTTGRISLMDFWIRRVRRLLPAMLSMLLFTTIWLLAIDPSRLRALKGDFLSSLLYVNNWWLIFHQVSYFESFGPVSPIGHLWSLSIEEQFYMAWPILLLLGLQLTRRRGKLTLLILACAAASAAAMGMMYAPGSDPSRVYYGTDTRMFALLIGAALAVLWPSRKLNAAISPAARGLLDIIGFLGLAVLMLLMHRCNEYDDGLYQGGFLIIAFITAAAIAALVHPASLAGNIMGLKPLRWIGVRSYSLYVWHYPVIILTHPEVDTGGPSILRISLQLAASVILAALSYKYIEEPLRRGRASKIRHSLPLRRRRLQPVIWTAVLLLILVPLTYSAALSKTGSEAAAESSGVTNGMNKQQEALPPSPKVPEYVTKPSPPDPSTQKIPVSQTHETPSSERTGPITSQEKEHSGKGITAIGDSVILDAAPFLEKKLPGIIIDGKVGRQMHEVDDVIAKLKARGKLGSRVIIELGTNGPFNTQQLRKVLNSLDHAKQVILVNTRVPRKWQDTVNEDIAKVSNEFGNVTVVDWYSASEGKDDYFYRDGVHLKQDGAAYYAELLVQGIRNEKR